MIDDKIQELIDNHDKMREVLHIAELDALIHGIYPGIAFTMDYRVEVGKRAQRPFFIAECREDLTEASGIFAQVLKECKIDTFNTAIKWEENAGYQVWFGLHLSYSHFDGGSNGMGIADFNFDGKEWTKYRFKGEER